MRIPEDTKQTQNDTIEQKLMECVRSLLESASRLKNALVGRNVEGIWDALAEQEEQAGLLNEYTALWRQMSSLANPKTALDLERRRLHLEIRRLQALQRANSMLAQSFLSAVRKAVSTVTDQAAAGGGTYSKLGRRRAGASSGLVKRYG